jgi:hypothetical protein
MKKPLDLSSMVPRGSTALPTAAPKPPAPSQSPAETEATKTTSVRIPVSLHKWARSYCVENDTTLQDIFLNHLKDLHDRYRR